MQVYQQFNVDVVPPAFNFIKNESPALAFTYEFWKKNSNRNVIKNVTPAQLFFL